MPDLATLELRITSAEAELARRRLDDLSRSAEVAERRGGTLRRAFGSLGNSVLRTARFMGGLGTAIGVAVGSGASLRSLIQFENGLIGVAKTADLAGKDLESFGDSIIGLSLKMPVSTSKLLDIATAAGQLGVKGVDNLTLFTETIAKMGSAADISGDEAATALARILNITGESISGVKTLASVIVALGNSAAAGEREITEMSTRIAQSTAAFKITSTEVAALATALVEVGVQAEAGGTAIGKTFRQLNEIIREGGARLQILTNITGLTRQAMDDLVKSSPLELFREFTEGLGKVEATRIDEVMDKLGLQGERLAAVIPTIAQNSERLREKLAIMNAELENTVALDAESARAAATLGSRLSILGNTINAVILKFRDSTGALAVFVDRASEVVRVLFELEGSFGQSEEGSDSFGRGIRRLKDNIDITFLGFETLAAKLATLAEGESISIESIVQALLKREMVERRLRDATANRRAEDQKSAEQARQELLILKQSIALRHELLAVVSRTTEDILQQSQIIRTRIRDPLGAELLQLQFEEKRTINDLKAELIKSQGLDPGDPLTEGRIEDTLGLDRIRAAYKQLRNATVEAFHAQEGFNNSLENLKILAEDIGFAFGHAFENMIFDAKSAKEAFKELGEEIARLLFRRIIVESLVSSISGFFPRSGGTNTSAGATAQALGGVFGPGGIIPLAAGAILNGPTFFGSGGRQFVAGEAGPEAVMPLRRTSSGELGVVGAGGAGVQINIINNTPAPIRSEEQQGSRGKAIDIIVGDIIARDMKSRGPASIAMESQFGLTRGGVRRG